MTDMLENDYAEQVPKDQLEGQFGKIWYLTHLSRYRSGKDFQIGPSFLHRPIHKLMVLRDAKDLKNLKKNVFLMVLVFF